MSHHQKEVLQHKSSVSTLNVNTNCSDQQVIITSAITIVTTPTAIINGGKETETNNKDIATHDKPYSIFSRSQKVMIVVTVSVSSFFSPFSANIYFPALKIIEKDLHITERMVSLTVTMYMVLQGTSPSFWGSLSDSWGRRPVYIMTFLIYILACIGLALTQNYVTLIALRMTQAFGSSSAIAVGAGAIGDITTPVERAGYMGIFAMGTMLGPLIGPFLGGILSHEVGWRWIFWVLTMMVVPLWLTHLFFLPETLRCLVGDGSGYANPTPLQYWRYKREQKRAQKQNDEEKIASDKNNNQSSSASIYSSITACKDEEECMKITVNSVSKDTIQVITPHQQKNKRDNTDTSSDKGIQLNHTKQPTKSRFLVLPNPFRSLGYLREKDVAVLLLYNSLQYAGLYCVITSITELFINIYGINETQVGLCYLSNGFGASLGSFTSGRILNWRFRKIAESLGFDEKNTKRHSIAPEFPIEQARMGVTWIWGITFNIAMVIYGWCLYYKVHIAVPIIINFILSYTSTSTFNATNTLLVDLFPKNSAAIIASNNLTRCLLGAVAVFIVQPGVQLMGVGWFFTAVSLLLLVSRITMLIELKYGPKWRAERCNRQAEFV